MTTFMSMVSDYGLNPTQEGFDAIYARYLSDCRAAASPAGVVKPLEWEHRPASDEHYERWTAYSILGTYHIYNTPDSYTWFLEGKTGGNAQANSADAKSAAFADYSARIMSAIEPAGVGVETAIQYHQQQHDKLMQASRESLRNNNHAYAMSEERRALWHLTCAKDIAALKGDEQ